MNAIEQMQTFLPGTPIYDQMEVFSLERLLSDDLKCQSSHFDARNAVCSTEVVARNSACVPIMGCANAAKYWQNLIDEHWSTCIHCSKECSDCWKVVMI